MIGSGLGVPSDVTHFSIAAFKLSALRPVSAKVAPSLAKYSAVAAPIPDYCLKDRICMY